MRTFTKAEYVMAMAEDILSQRATYEEMKGHHKVALGAAGAAALGGAAYLAHKHGLTLHGGGGGGGHGGAIAAGGALAALATGAGYYRRNPDKLHQHVQQGKDAVKGVWNALAGHRTGTPIT